MISVGLLGLLAIPSESLVEPAEADNTRTFAGGDGTVGNPYQISDVFQLQEMNLSLDAHYVLVNDIDAADTESWNSGDGFEPIGVNINKFTGSLRGQGYDIMDLFINRDTTYHVGFFGCIGAGANLNNITLIDNNISGKKYVGGLVGINYHGTISDCYTSGIINGEERVGGFVGTDDQGTISGCYATGIVNGAYEVGGFVGRIEDGMISDCFASGNFSGIGRIGGLVGYLEEGKISNCYATGNVSGNVDLIGGLVGEN